MATVGRLLFASLVTALALASPALAEVAVLPGSVEVDRPREFTIVVRNTTRADTVRVQVDFPEQIAVASLGPPPLDWGLRSLPSGVEYRGGAIRPGDRLSFTVRGTATAGGAAIWRAAQQYSDLRVDRFASAVTIIGGVAPSPPPATDRPPSGEEPAAPEPPAPEPPADPPRPETGPEPARAAAADDANPPAWLGFIAILLALGALAAAGFVWAKRPPPADDDPAAES